MKLAIGCDHGGLEIKNAILHYFKERGIDYTDFGTCTAESVDYPVYAKKVCAAVQSGEYQFGILCCGTGIGMSMVANKQKGIRAAVLSDAFSAEMTRRHNNANVLCLGGRIIDGETAVRLTELFLSTPFDGGRHQKRVDMIENGTENGGA